MSDTYTEGGVTIQYCDEPGCNEFLGVNYPAHYCLAHRR